MPTAPTLHDTSIALERSQEDITSTVGAGGHHTRSAGSVVGGASASATGGNGPSNAAATDPSHAAATATGPGGGDKMQTRMRAGSLIRPPRHADDPLSTSPNALTPPSTLSLSEQAALSHHHPIAPKPTGRRLSITSSSLLPNVSVATSASAAAALSASPSSSHSFTQPPLLSSSSSSSHPSPNPPPRSHHARPKPSTSSSHLSDSTFDGQDGRKHPRDFVPPTIGFPAPGMEGKIHKEDSDDRLLMATCAVLHSHENRALCPKELAEVMIARGWLLNAGTTPFAHVSTCIRSHLRRCTTSVPPYSPLLTSFELVGSLKDYEVRAVGLRSEDRPAVKRGTLWYLDERVLGKNVGAEDPFIRCQREAGLSPSEKNGIYVRTLPPAIPVVPVFNNAMEDDDDDSGMGRGKRKRRASSAAMAALETPIIGTPGAIPIPSAAGGNALATSNRPWANGHRRTNSMSNAGLSASMPKLGGGMRLTLRLTALEEADSSIDDSDGATSDAQRRKKNKKKARRATSEGGTGMSRAGSSTGSIDEDDDELLSSLPRSNTFSSASSSALLAKSLLAASQLSPAQQQARLDDLSSPHSVVSPDSLHSGPFSHHLSLSAPGLFSSFPAAPSPESMDIDYGERRTTPSADLDNDSADEDDFHEAMLRGEDFDFEWSSETYAMQTSNSSTSFSQHKKGKQREMSLDLPEHFDSFNKDDELDLDEAASTPATTPRSPAASRDDDADVDMAASFKQGMEATLCQAFEQHKDTHAPTEPEDVKPEVHVVVARAGSAESLTSLPEEELVEEDEEPTQRGNDESLSVPLPSPLGLDIPPPLGNQAFSSEYDFVGHEEDDPSAYRSTYDRDMAESADDEDEDDDIVTVKIEEEGSVGPESAPSSRQSSVYPIESFTRRLMVDVSSSSSSSGSSDSDQFDPQMIVTSSMLASGLPVPQVAPSPPDTTDANDWAMHLDLEDLDIDLGGGTDLLGPESVGLEELDLAWGGPDEQGDDETVEEWRARQESKAAARGLASGPSFKTRSPIEEVSPPPVALEETSRVSSPARPVAPQPTVSPSLSATTTSRSATPLTPSLKPSAPGSVIVYPKTPLTPVVTATIVQRGVAVYATDVVDPETQETYPILRRIDTDYINGTVLLTGVFARSEDRDAALAGIADTFKVSSGGRAVEGIWVTLSSARLLAKRHSSLSRLDTFLEDDLGSRFPEPLPAMRTGLRNALASASSTSHNAFGWPVFEDTESDSVNPRQASLPPKKSVGRGRARRTSTITKESGSDEAKPVLSPVASVRKTRRSVVTK